MQEEEEQFVSHDFLLLDRPTDRMDIRCLLSMLVPFRK